MYLFQHDKTFYYAWELLSKVILFSLSRSESSSNLSSMYLWTLNFDIFLLFCGSKYRWLSFNFSWCESLLFVTSSTRQDQRFVFSVFCVFWKLLYVLWIWMTSSKNECKSRLSHVFTLKVLDFKIMSLFFSRMLRKTGLPKRARIFLSARRMWRIWTMLWWKWRTGLHFQRQTTIPTGIDLVNIICITIIISSPLYTILDQAKLYLQMYWWTVLEQPKSILRWNSKLSWWKWWISMLGLQIRNSFQFEMWWQTRLFWWVWRTFLSYDR